LTGFLTTKLSTKLLKFGAETRIRHFHSRKINGNNALFNVSNVSEMIFNSKKHFCGIIKYRTSFVIELAKLMSAS
jgi:hypothetical protein